MEAGRIKKEERTREGETGEGREGGEGVGISRNRSRKGGEADQ